MQHRSILRSYFAGPAPEAVPCVPDAGGWAAQQWLEHLAVDVTGLEEALIVDPTLERRMLPTGKRIKIRGIRNGTFSARVKLHGTGAVTAIDSQVAETGLAKTLKHCLGGLHRTYSRTIVSGTTTVITFANTKTAGFIPGCLVAFEDTTAPDTSSEGKLHFARVIAVDDGADTITLSEELPFTPAAGDIAHSTITIYPVESFLEDAVTAGGLASWLIKKTRADTDHLWEALGCVATMGIANLGRGQLPEVSLAIMTANFNHTAYDDLVDPVPGTALGFPQLSMGRDAHMLLSPYDATDREEVEYNAAAFEPGIARERVFKNQ